MAVKFDPTISLSDLAMALSLMAAVGASYYSLDKRVAVLEEKATVSLSRSAEQQAEQKDAIHEIRSDIKDVQRSLNDITRAMSLPANRRAP